jgi:hypothetical protein
MDDMTYGTQPDDVTDHDLSWAHPSALAVASVVLATLSLMGASVFRGPAYTLTLADISVVGSGSTGGNGYLVAGAFLTAAFALLPLLMARRGLRRLVPDDGPWTDHLLRAAFLLAGVSLALHLVLAVLVSISDLPWGYSGALFS